MTHKQWFNNVLHLHPVHEEGAVYSNADLPTAEQHTSIVQFMELSGYVAKAGGTLCKKFKENEPEQSLCIDLDPF